MAYTVSMKKLIAVSLLLAASGLAQTPAQTDLAAVNRAVARLAHSGTSAAHLDCSEALIEQHNKVYPEARIATVEDIREELYGKPTPQQKSAAKVCAAQTLKGTK